MESLYHLSDVSHWQTYLANRFFNQALQNGLLISEDIAFVESLLNSQNDINNACNSQKRRILKYLGYLIKSYEHL